MAKKKYVSGHTVKLIHSGDEYFDELISIIDSAKSVLHLQFYIFDNDSTGKIILEAMKRASQRKVRIYLMVDGFGSYSLNREFVKDLRNHGIFFRFFSPLPFPGITQAARRLHHKVCVADGIRAIIGGINVADKYRGIGIAKPWLDYAVSFKGPVCREIDGICLKIWKRKFVRSWKEKILPSEIIDGGVKLRVNQNDWVRRKNEISAAYKQMLKATKKEILIVASYFIPTRRLLSILIREAKLGRSVRVILAHNSDVPFIKPAMNYLYSRLLKSGVKIFEYEASVLHAKVCVVDREWTSIGSHNLNHLSEFMSMEMNVDILDKNFANAFADELEVIIKNDCVEIKTEEFLHTSSVWGKIKNWTSYRLLSAVQRILYALNRREGKAPTKRRRNKLAN